MPFADNAFDVTYSISVVERIYEKYLEAIREMVRVTKNGGIIYVTFPVSSKHQEEWMRETIYSKQAHKDEMAFFQYRFSENDVKNIIGGIDGIDVIARDIFWEKFDGKYDKMIGRLRQKSFNRYFKFLKNSFTMPFVGLSFFEEEPQIDFSRARSFGNLQLGQLRKKGFSVVLYPASSRSFTGDELVHMANAKESVGFAGDASNLDDHNREKDNRWFTKVLTPDPDFEKGFLEVGRYRYFCEQLGVKIGDSFVPRIAVSPDDAAVGMRVLKECGWKGGNYVVVAPGAGLRYRSWPTDKFATVVEYFTQNNLEVVFSGSAVEQALYDAISGKVSGGSLINLMGKTNLLQLGGVLQRAVMYFGSDTGTVHLAAAVGTPTVCLLGGGHFGRFFPYGDLKKNKIVYDKHMTCKYDDWACARTVPPGQPAPCIAGITVEDALAEIKNMLT
jgi:ADP-heptose:LPS heptosyltransferase